jgi:hypothetical protein
MTNEFIPILEAMDLLQRGRILPINPKQPRIGECPATKQSGLYWIYSSYAEQDFLESVHDEDKTGSMDFARAVRRHAGLSHVCTVNQDGFRLVYNGIGGTGPKNGGGLRERILGEINGGHGTGSLAIKHNSLNDLSRWKFSYVLWEEIRLPADCTYPNFAEALEVQWRLHFGWPLLCAR